MTPMRAAAFPTLLLILTACAATRANVTPYAAQPAVAVQAVEVFTERVPDREYQELGLIEVVGNIPAGWGDLIMRAREEAAKLGADAVIISRRPIETVSAVALDPDMAMATAGEVPRVWAIAVRWRD